MALVTQPAHVGGAFGAFDRDRFAGQAHKQFVALVSLERGRLEEGERRDRGDDEGGGAARSGPGPLVAPLTVVVRKRPMNASERALGQYDVLSCAHARRTVVHEPKVKFDLSLSVHNHAFTFDKVYGEGSSTLDMYKDLLRPMVLNLDRGSHFTCFAYGQTGSGKSFTMSGLVDAALEDIFRLVLSSGNRARHLLVAVSYFEIYCSKVYDLLNGRTVLPLREDESRSVHVVGLTEHGTRDVRVARELLARGTAARSIGSTKVNADSSRSHSVLQLLLLEGAESVSSPGTLLGRASLVDLAGSEQAHESAPPDKATHHEAAEINKSLLALKECIRAMARGQAGGGGARHASRSSSAPSASSDEARGEEGREEGEEGADWGARVGVGETRLGVQLQRGRGDAASTLDLNFSYDPYRASLYATGRPPTASGSARGSSSLSSIPRGRARGGGRKGARRPHVHLPFRGSKLTQILRDSFTCPGAVTVMIATVGPGNVAAGHSLNTLRYADRLKAISARHESGGGGASIAASTSASGVTTGALTENKSGVKTGLLADQPLPGQREGARMSPREVLVGGFTHTDPSWHSPPAGLGHDSEGGGSGGIGLVPVQPTWVVGAAPPDAVWRANEDVVRAMRREAGQSEGVVAGPSSGGTHVRTAVPRGLAAIPAAPPAAPPPFRARPQTSAGGRPAGRDGSGTGERRAVTTASDALHVMEAAEALARRSEAAIHASVRGAARQREGGLSTSLDTSAPLSAHTSVELSHVSAASGASPSRGSRPAPMTAGAGGGSGGAAAHDASHATPHSADLVALLDAQIAQLESLKAKMAKAAGGGGGSGARSPAARGGGGGLAAAAPSSLLHIHVGGQERPSTAQSAHALTRSALQRAVTAASATVDSINLSVERSLGLDEEDEDAAHVSGRGNEMHRAAASGRPRTSGGQAPPVPSYSKSYGREERPREGTHATRPSGPPPAFTGHVDARATRTAHPVSGGLRAPHARPPVPSAAALRPSTGRAPTASALLPSALRASPYAQKLPGAALTSRPSTSGGARRSRSSSVADSAAPAPPLPQQQQSRAPGGGRVSLSHGDVLLGLHPAGLGDGAGQRPSEPAAPAGSLKPPRKGSMRAPLPPPWEGAGEGSGGRRVRDDAFLHPSSPLHHPSVLLIPGGPGGGGGAVPAAARTTGPTLPVTVSASALASAYRDMGLGGMDRGVGVVGVGAPRAGPGHHLTVQIPPSMLPRGGGGAILPQSPPTTRRQR